MKAIVLREYGPPEAMRLEEVPVPAPGDDGVVVKVRAAGVNPLDWRLMRGEPYPIRLATGLRRPSTGRVGADFAGEVEAVGAGVTHFKPGDLVFGGCEARGAFAERIRVPESEVGPKPDGITFEEAAAMPVAALTALQGLRDAGGIKAGQSVLVNGAAGGVGTFAVQIAKAYGAHVTGVCSGANAEMVRGIGADAVIDYTREDFTLGGRRYDLVFDCMGNHPLAAIRRVLAPEGTYVVVGGGSGRWLGPLVPLIAASVTAPFVRQKLRPLLSHASRADLLALKVLVESGKVKPVIDRTYTLAEVPEAVRYVEKGHARGKVVIRVADG